jgi:glutathione S-transferase
MARYKLHCNGGSGNSYKLALYLNCAGLDWEPIGVDFAGGQTRDPDWRAGTNAMGEVPVLEVNGQRMSQSGAILVWLAETTGKFALLAPTRVSRRYAGCCSIITSSRITMRCIDFNTH